VIDAKIEGREVAEPVEEAPPKVVNLMEALRKSLDSVKKKPATAKLSRIQNSESRIQKKRASR
jgi:non-homologous end joining protein Ku